MARSLRTTRIANLNRGVYNSILMYYRVNGQPTSLEGATITLTCKDVPFDDESDSTSAKFIITGELDPEDNSKVLFPITAEQSQLDPESVYYADIVVVEENDIPLRKAILEFGVTGGPSNANSGNTTIDGAVGSRVFINDCGSQSITIEVITGEKGDPGSLEIEGVAGNFVSISDGQIAEDSGYNPESFAKPSDVVNKTDANYDLIETFSLSTDASAVTADMDTINLSDGTQSSTQAVFPTANETEAGMMNAATFLGLEQAKNDIVSLKNEAFAANGVPEIYTQTDITNAWIAASGQTTVINGAVLWDIDNQRRFGYYGTSSGEEWILTNSGGGSTPIANFTNSVPGLIKGSASEGQVFAEADGTGSVNGYDTLKSSVSTNTSDISALSSGKLDKITDASTNDRAYVVSSSGDQSITDISSSPLAGTIVERDASGRSQVSAPSSASDITNKSYVDALIPSPSKVAYGCTLSASASLLVLSDGAALVDGEWVIVDQQTIPNTTTVIPAGGVGYLTLDSSGTLKQHADSIGEFPPKELPLGVISKNSSNQWLPASIIDFNMTKADNIDFDSIGDFNYASSEVATSSKWVDGKTIYKKTILKTTAVTTGTTRITHDVAGIDLVVKLESFMTDGTSFLPFPYGTSTNAYANTTQIVIDSTGTYTTYTRSFFTMYYTKV
ncbi:MAG: hypothetical protein ACK5MU_03980 [Candidatus Saccharimonadales bacterium]